MKSKDKRPEPAAPRTAGDAGRARIGKRESCPGGRFHHEHHQPPASRPGGF
jgi:hypothetical protein